MSRICTVHPFNVADLPNERQRIHTHLAGISTHIPPTHTQTHTRTDIPSTYTQTLQNSSRSHLQSPSVSPTCARSYIPMFLLFQAKANICCSFVLFCLIWEKNTFRKYWSSALLKKTKTKTSVPPSNWTLSRLPGWRAAHSSSHVAIRWWIRAADPPSALLSCQHH